MGKCRINMNMKMDAAHIYYLLFKSAPQEPGTKDAF